MLEQRIQQQFFDSADLQYRSAETLLRPIADASAAVLSAITGGGKVMVCGSGAGQALALHLARLFTGRFERERPPLAGRTDVLVAVPAERNARVAELQMLVLHCLCDAVDFQLLGDQES